MLLTQDARDVSKSGVMETAKATIKATPKIFSFFADQTYANKPKAICRELVANAVDSHVMAGKGDQPVEVWLPCLVDPVFKVRDFGLGMSHDFMMGPFMAYTDGSTKDQSNIAIGGFGIGSKSPFAYVDQYTIKSTFDGTVSVYSVFKDDDGIPSIALLAQKSTDEPNGVEVSFPVEPSDFENFRVAAFEALKYFDPLPIVRNAGQSKFEAEEYAAKGKTWGMRKTSGPLQVIMGGIMYPVDAANLTYKFKDETAKKMLTYGLDIKVPIGTCSIALSREQLSYDERTIEGLTKACLSVVDEVAQSFATIFDQHDTVWDAMTALYEEVYPNGHSGYRGETTRGQFLSQKAQWRGQPLEMNLEFILPGGAIVWDLDPYNYRRGGKTPNPKWEHYDIAYKVMPGKFEHVVIDDLPRNSKSKTILRIKEWLADQDQKKRILFVRATNESLKPKKILEALGNPSNYTLTSTLPEPINATVTAAGTVRPKVRMFTYDGQKRNYGWGPHSYYETLHPGRYGKSGIKEIDYAAQPSSGILVVMENFKPPASFYEKMETGLVAFGEVHFVNQGDAPKLNKSLWKSFDDVFTERLDKKLASVHGLGEMLAVEQAFPHDFRVLFHNNRSFPFATQKQKNSPFAKLEKAFRDFVEPIQDDNRKFAPFVTVALPKGVDPVKLKEKFEEQSPRASRLLQLFDHRIQNDDDMQFFIDNL